MKEKRRKGERSGGERRPKNGAAGAFRQWIIGGIGQAGSVAGRRSRQGNSEAGADPLEFVEGFERKIVVTCATIVVLVGRSPGVMQGEESREGKSLFRFGFMQAVVFDKGRQHRQLGKVAQGEEASQRPIDEQYVGGQAQYRAIFG